MTPEERYNQVAQRYSENPQNQGLGAQLRSLFAAEGPEAAGTFVRIPGADQSPGGRLNAIMSLAENLKFNNQDALEGYLGDIAERTMGYEGLSIPVEGLVPDEGGFFGGGGPFMSEGGQQFGFGGNDISEMEKARREIQENAILPEFDQGLGTGDLNQEAILKQRVKDSNLAERELLGEEAQFQPSALDEIGELLTRLDAKPKDKEKPELKDAAPSPTETLEATLTGGRGDIVEKPGERAAYLKAQKEKNAKKTGKEIDPLGPDAAANAFFSAMQDVSDSPSPKGESKEDAIARYRKEFEDATGINASGKIDKSRALIAFGLALLKNKAGGKGISGIISELGEAGEIAMPYLDKATADSKAAQLAAGQYALQQQKNDLSAERAAAQADSDFKKDVYLKWYDSQLKRQEDNLQAQADLLKAQVEGGPEYDKKHEFTFATGQGDASSWKIPVVYDKNTPTGGIILKPEAYARKYIDGRTGVEDAIDVISEMRNASMEIAQGGGTAKFAYDRLNSIGKALFPNLNTGNPSSEQEYAQGVNLLMGRFKRFLTQETGNGISNRDVEIWENEIMKKPGWFTNFDETNSALNQLEDIFRAKLSEFDAGLDFIYNPENLDKGDFEKLVEKYGDLDQIQGSTGKLIFKDGKIVRAN